ncbi:MAG: hypothetical protein OJF49_004105 [Ktedonobacterales bacterium]|nr:MAG: hypothetical protein OJF49_004105 [Ktedonobacterales bacterium]
MGSGHATHRTTMDREPYRALGDDPFGHMDTACSVPDKFTN